MTHHNSDTVSVIDTATNDVTARPVGNSPYEVAVSPDGKKAYVTNFNNTGIYSTGTVSVIDTATDTVTATVNVGNSLVELQSTRREQRYM